MIPTIKIGQFKNRKFQSDLPGIPIPKQPGCSIAKPPPIPTQIQPDFERLGSAIFLIGNDQQVKIQKLSLMAVNKR